MDLSGIISIAGMPGLHKVVSQVKNGLIVESLIDKKRVVAYSTYKVSALEDISIFSTSKDVPLKEIFQSMFDKHKGGAAIDGKSKDEELKKYFGEIVPDYDQARVYVSDIRKVINWYNALQKEDLLKPKKEETAKDEETSKTSVAGEEKAKKTVKPKVAKPKAVAAKPLKPATGHKKTQGVRKTGTA